ncbi:MAG: hypothetical protein RR140_03395 [Clostridia bacterium]
MDNKNNSNLQNLSETSKDKQMPAYSNFVMPAKPKTDSEKKIAISKEEKNKVENINKKNKKFKINKVALSICIAFALSATLFSVIFVLVKNNARLDMPTNLDVVSISDKVFISVDQNANAEKYVFGVKRGEEPEVLYESDVHILNSDAITAFMSTGEIVKVRAQYKGKTRNANSSFTEAITFKKEFDLKAPKLFYDDVSQKFSWAPVEHALSYRIYYSSNQYFTYFPVSDAKNISYNSSPIRNLGAGSYNVFVVAVGKNENTSGLSNIINIVHQNVLDAPTSILWNNSEKSLSFNVLLNTGTYEIKITLKTDEIIILTHTTQDSGNAHIAYLAPVLHNTNIQKIEVRAVGRNIYETSSNWSDPYVLN